MGLKVLMIGQDKVEVSLLKAILQQLDYEVLVLGSEDSRADVLNSSAFDVVLLDITEDLADAQGKICLLKSALVAPILGIITPTIAGLIEETPLPVDVNAFIFRPFDAAELDVRLRLLVAERQSMTEKATGYAFVERRRKQHSRGCQRPPQRPNSMPFCFIVDARAKSVQIDGRTVELSPKEYELLTLFVERCGQVVTAEEIIERLWPQLPGTGDTQVQQYIYRLRHKVESDPANPRYINTIKGLGYRLVAPGNSEGIGTVADQAHADPSLV